MRILSTIVVLAASLAIPGVASASPKTELASAEQQSRQDSMLVKYHGKLSTIAARDLMTARALVIITARYRNAALRNGDSRAAEAYAQRHDQAQLDVQEAKDRLARETDALMRAREQFRRDAAVIAELDVRSRRPG